VTAKTVATEAAGVPGGRPEAQEGREVRRLEWVHSLLRNRLGMAGVVVIALVILVAVVGPWIWHINYADESFPRLLAPSSAHPMGTDNLGQDDLARVIHGAQVSLEVSVISVAMALFLGLVMGVVAAFYGGVVDMVLMRLTDIMFSIPGLILAILIAGMLGASRTNTIIAIALVYAPAFARVARATVLVVLPLPYLEAARVAGASDRELIMNHIVPNILSPLIVLTTLYLSSAILLEAGLGFLGLGVQPPEPSWGSMLNDARSFMYLAPWLAVFPGAAIMVAVLGFNFLGDGLRDALDPRLRDLF
jgi:peptide/nickel transport system permease protein